MVVAAILRRRCGVGCRSRADRSAVGPCARVAGQAGVVRPDRHRSDNFVRLRHGPRPQEILALAYQTAIVNVIDPVRRSTTELIPVNLVLEQLADLGGGTEGAMPHR